MRWFGRGLVALAVIAAVVGGVLHFQGRATDDEAAEVRAETTRLAAETTRVAAETERTGHAADEPIGLAEGVSGSISRISGASVPVLEAANAAQDALGRAVEVFNAGNPGGAQALYAGEVSERIRELQRLLDEARAVLAAAQAAALELAGSAA